MNCFFRGDIDKNTSWLQNFRVGDLNEPFALIQHVITLSKRAGLVATDWPTVSSNPWTHSVELGLNRFGELFYQKKLLGIPGIFFNVFPQKKCESNSHNIYASTDFHRWCARISWTNFRANCEPNHCLLVAGLPSWVKSWGKPLVLEGVGPLNSHDMFCKEPLSLSSRPGLISHLTPNSARPRVKANKQRIQADLCIHDGQLLMLLRGKRTSWGGSFSHELQSFRCSRSQIHRPTWHVNLCFRRPSTLYNSSKPVLISQVSMKPWPAITSNALANTRFGQLNAALATFSSNIISEKTPKLHTWRTDFATKCMSCYGFAAGRPGAASKRYWYRVVGSWWFSFSMDHVSQGVGVQDNLWKHHLGSRCIYTLHSIFFLAASPTFSTESESFQDILW